MAGLASGVERDAPRPLRSAEVVAESASTVAKVVAEAASTADEVAAEAMSTVTEIEAQAGSTADEAVAKFASTAVEGVPEVASTSIGGIAKFASKAGRASGEARDHSGTSVHSGRGRGQSRGRSRTQSGIRSSNSKNEFCMPHGIYPTRCDDSSMPNESSGTHGMRKSGTHVSPCPQRSEQLNSAFSAATKDQRKTPTSTV